MKSRGYLRWDADTTMTQAASRGQTPERLTDPYTDNALDLTIFVSCYNEADYIVNTLDTVCAAGREVGLEFEVIVIDDGSRDNSRDIVRDYIDRHPDEQIILRANRQNQGLAQNFVDGAFLGRGKYYRLICGDNSEPKETVVKILREIGKADIIIPYYTSSEGKGARREIISKSYTALVNLISGNKLHYYNGLPVCLRFAVMRWHPGTRGFGFQAELLCNLFDLGFTYLEVPMIVVERRVGRSNALTMRNLISVAHTIFEIFSRRLSKYVYGWK
ncbi:MAG: hypothetical protein QOH67_4650 [Hyphomicrobiales bacterium]|jgi:glycosyltransferase involved in cell wall biosynthesis|nr:hypothetical protein [Hyphomicrobiales bacterium]